MGIQNGKKYMDTVTYSGTNSVQSIGGLDFSPDLVWIKSRTEGTHQHNLLDTVRGTNSILSSDSTSAEVTNSTDAFVSFDPTGFTLGPNVLGTQSNELNYNAGDFVAWCWSAGGTTVTNNEGSVEAQVRSNGNFSIVKASRGSSLANISFGHGLNKSPSFVIVKTLGDNFWLVGHSYDWTKQLYLNTTDAAGSDGNVWVPSPPDSDVVYLGTSSYVNANSDFIAYCWCESDMQSFGEYTGNGSASGPFIYTAFKPAFVMIKGVDSTSPWTMVDAERGTNKILYADSSGTEDTNSSRITRLLSNGFTVGEASDVNTSNQRYIYMAFGAESFIPEVPTTEITLSGTKDWNNLPVGNTLSQTSTGASGVIQSKDLTSGKITLSGTVQMETGSPTTTTVDGTGEVVSYNASLNRMTLKNVTGGFASGVGKHVDGSIRRLPKYQSETAVLTGVNNADPDYLIANSLRFDSGEQASLARTNLVEGNRRKWTYSFWTKLSNSNINFYQTFLLSGSGNIRIDNPPGTKTLYVLLGSGASAYISDMSFKDSSDWIHFVMVWDSDNNTESDRFIVYVDGERITGTFTCPQGTDSYFNTADFVNIGYYNTNTALDCLFADANFIDGQSLTPNSFGEYNPFGQWIAKEYTGGYVAEQDTSLLVDTSSPGKYASVTDINNGSGTVFTSDYGAGPGSIKLTFETPVPNVSSITFKGGGYLQYATFSIKINGNVVLSNLSTNTAYAIRTEAITSTDITTFEIVSDDGWALGNLQFNGIDAPGNPILRGSVVYSNSFHLDFSDPTSLGKDSSGGGNDFTSNNLVGNFTYSDEETSIITGASDIVIESGFVPVIYTGNGTSQDISCGFSPDLVWIKDRTDTYQHILVDVIRGDNYYSSSNTTSSQTNDSNAISALSADGFSIGGSSAVNKVNDKFVAWCWDAGDTTVTNNEGSIESQVRSNGNFSIVRYTGTGILGTVGHDLSSPTDFLIIKRLDSTGQWRCWHSSLSNTQAIDLNENSGAFTDDSFNNTIPTDSVFTVNTNIANVNTSGGEYIAYCWSESPTQTFGEYTGNGLTDGPVIDCGFEPAFVMVKRVNSTGNWVIVDSGRDNGKELYPELDNVESGASYRITITSSGFQPTSAAEIANGDGDTYIYAAFGSDQDATVLELTDSTDLSDFLIGQPVTQDSVGTPETSAITNVAVTPALTSLYYFTGAPSNLADVITNGTLVTPGLSKTTSQNMVAVIPAEAAPGYAVFSGNMGYAFSFGDGGTGGGHYLSDGTRLGGSGGYGPNEAELIQFGTSTDYDTFYEIPTIAAYTVFYNGTQTGEPADIADLNTLTLTNDTNVANFRVGDVVQEEITGAFLTDTIPTPLGLKDLTISDAYTQRDWDSFIADQSIAYDFAGFSYLTTPAGVGVVFNYISESNQIVTFGFGSATTMNVSGDVTNPGDQAVTGNTSGSPSDISIGLKAGTGQFILTPVNNCYLYRRSAFGTYNPVKVTANNPATPSITTDGGTWNTGETITGQNIPLPTGKVASVDTTLNTMTLSDSTGTWMVTESGYPTDKKLNKFVVTTHDYTADSDNLLDSPTDYGTDTGRGGEVRSNYCTWNPLVVDSNGYNVLSEGNLVANHNSGGWAGNVSSPNGTQILGTIGVSSGKWYWEYQQIAGEEVSFGIADSPVGTQYYPGYQGSVGYSNTQVYNGIYPGTGVSNMPTIAVGDIIGVALDMDTGKVYFSNNGVFINGGDPVGGTGECGSGMIGQTMFPAVAQLGGSGTYTLRANFGQRPFIHPAPDGYKTLNTLNL